MTPPHQQDRAAARTIPTDLDLALERRANARGEMRLTDDDLAAVVRTAELLGCDVAAERIRAAARRRAGRAALHAVPDVGGRRRASTPNRPILVALDGQAADVAELEPDELWWDEVHRLALRHEAADLKPTSRRVLEAVRRAAQASLR